MPNKPKSEAQGIQLSYRYRIYPTPEQEKALAFEFDACRYVYNHFLRARTESWERTQKTLRRPKLAPGADPNARHPEYVKDSNGNRCKSRSCVDCIRVGRRRSRGICRKEVG